MMSLFGAALPATAVDLSEPGTESIADIAACAADSDNLLAAIVVDSSGSLRETDPADQRVGAVLQALESLEQLQLSDDDITVQANLATFGTSFEPIVGWDTVESTHAQSLKNAATSVLPQRDSDAFTDYRAALLGAQASLNSQAANLDGVSCKVTFWFTDGRLDVGSQTDLARSELCTPQGIVDSVRADRIAIVALALFVEGGSVTPQERERLRAIAEGSGEGETCGTVPIPSSSASGAYLRAADPNSMRRLFAQATSMIGGATPARSLVCPSAECVDGTLTIPLDAGVAGFRVILERSAGTPTLVGPDGQSSTATTDLTMLSGGNVQVSDNDGLMTLDVHTGNPDADTEWVVQMDPSSTTLVDLYYIWGAALQVASPDPLFVSERGLVRFTLVNATGDEVTPDDFASVRISAIIDGLAVTPTHDGDAWTASIDVPATEVAPTLHVEATARAVTMTSGLQLGPVSASADLATRFPPKFPTLDTTRLVFPAIAGDTPAVGQLVLRGSDEGDTRACLESSRAEGPESAGAVTVAAQQECIDIPSGATAAFDLTLSATNPADGRIDGEVILRLEGVDGADTVTTAVPFGASMERPVNEPLRWLLVVALCALALLILWVVAELFRRLGERFSLSIQARVASVPVSISRQGLRRIPDQRPLLEPSDDFTMIAAGALRPSAEFSTSGLTFRRSFPALNPLASAQAWVEASDGAVVLALGPGRPVLDNVATKAPVRLPGSIDSVLVVEMPANDTELRGRLVVVVDSRDGVAAVLDERLSQIETTDWDQIVDTALAAFSARSAASAATSSRRSRGGRVGKGAARAQEAASATELKSAPEQDAPPRSSWADEPDSPSSPRPSRQSDRGTSPAPRNDPPQSDPPQDSPPPSPNFWD